MRWVRRAQWSPDRLPAGAVIFIRRTSEQGDVALLGHTWRIDPHWAHRLVRAEVDLAHGAIRCYALRRSAPDDQPLLRELAYTYPRHSLWR